MSGDCVDLMWNDPTVILPIWHKCDYMSLTCYVNYLDRLLKHVKAPVYMLSDCHTDFTSSVIDAFYHDVISCVHKAVAACIPHRQSAQASSRNLPGWNTYIREKHDLARAAYRDWVCNDKPKFDAVFAKSLVLDVR